MTSPASGSAADSLQGWREAAAGCKACDLWERATQTVFGEGSVPARLMLVGEQPGDQEDRAGHPFVGPAGRVLDEALTASGVDRDDLYVTNAVKHFKWQPRGKRRIHDTPSRLEVVACRQWLDKELELVEPDMVVALGATAAKAFFGPSFRLTQHRGEIISRPDLAPACIATTHPSAVLRARDEQARAELMDGLVADLALAASEIRGTG